VEAIDQFIKAAPIDIADDQLELVPEAYLDQAEPTHADVMEGMRVGVRDLFAYLVKIERAELRTGLIGAPSGTRLRPRAWRTFVVTDFFDLHRGHFHSITDLDQGPYATISRVSTDNG